MADEVPDGTIPEIREWVGHDHDRATAAIKAEKKGKKRQSLINELEAMRHAEPHTPASSVSSSPGEQNSSTTVAETDDVDLVALREQLEAKEAQLAQRELTLDLRAVDLDEREAALAAGGNAPAPTAEPASNVSELKVGDFVGLGVEHISRGGVEMIVDPETGLTTKKA